MDMDQLYDYRARLLDRLESIPDEIAQAARAVTPEKLRRPKPSGKMSPHQIVARLQGQPHRAREIKLPPHGREAALDFVYDESRR
ncbi:MAG: hypothetical protein HZB77_05810, partial [Chloroflexi bacterium]|nr:hypothetical protein [Chloroflexota bacterium]